MSKKNNNELMERFPILHFFAYKHLPENLQKISQPFHEQAWGLAWHMKETEYPQELSAGLRKLLEAKDCFVRAALSPKKE